MSQFENRTVQKEELTFANTDNWETYINYQYGFSLKYPRIEEGYYGNYNDASFFDLTTKEYKSSGDPWLYITWEESQAITEDAYIRSTDPCWTPYQQCNWEPPVLFNEKLFQRYSNDFGIIYSIKIPDKQVFIKAYKVNFDSSIVNAILGSLEFENYQLPQIRTHSSNLYSFEFSDKWNYGANISKESAYLDQKDMQFSVDSRGNFTVTGNAVIDSIDQINQYDYSSTSTGDTKIGQPVKGKQVQVDGQVGYMYQWQYRDPYIKKTRIYIPYQNNLIIIEYNGNDLDPMNDILKTLRFK